MPYHMTLAKCLQLECCSISSKLLPEMVLQVASNKASIVAIRKHTHTHQLVMFSIYYLFSSKLR